MEGFVCSDSYGVQSCSECNIKVLLSTFMPLYLGDLYEVRCHEPRSSFILYFPHDDTCGSCEVKLHNLIVHSLRNFRWCRFPAPYAISPLHHHLVYYCLYIYITYFMKYCKYFVSVCTKVSPCSYHDVKGS